MPDSHKKYPDSLEYWIQRYRELAVHDIRSEAVEKKIALHLNRFLNFFKEFYGHDRISTCLRRDALAWQATLNKRYAASTVNNHMASLSGFTTWGFLHKTPKRYISEICSWGDHEFCPVIIWCFSISKTI